MRLMRRRPLAFLLLAPLAASLFLAAEPPTPRAAEADALWEARAAGATGGVALAGPIDAVIVACRKGIAESPGALDLRWRLMRALYFKGEYAVPDDAAKRAVFDEGKAAGEEALALIRKEAGARTGKSLEGASPVELGPAVSGRPDVVAAFYWASVDWGKWALAFGKTAAVKKGAATKIRDYATAVIQLDPRFEGGGGYRVLGRLHHQTPSVPFLTGWASRDEALRNLRLAVKTEPSDLINRLYLAEAMWDYETARRDEARKALEAVIAAAPAPGFPVEERKTQDTARALLAGWGKP
jgi:tetratricopeptide (TPR) repeat protein